MGSYIMTTVVHKEGEEGVLNLDPQTGKIVTPVDQRPDWAEGLATGLIQERLSFYEKRFGAESANYKAVTSAPAVEFSDLGWIGLDAEQNELEVFADPTYRSEVVAKAMGIDTETGEMDRTAIAERDVSRENRGRTQSEIAALEDSVAQGFTGTNARTETMKDRQTGTHR